MRLQALVVGLVMTAAAAQAAKPVMVVNGIEVNDIELFAAKQAMAAQAQGQTLDDSILARRAMEQVTARILLGGEARRAKVVLDQKKLDATMEEQRRLAGGAEKFAQSLLQLGLTEAELRRITGETVLVRDYVEETLAPTVKVTDDEVKADYDANPDKFKHAEQSKLRMILVEPPPDASDAVKATAKAKAESLLGRLKAGEDFAELAKSQSDDPTRSTGGEIGWVSRGRLLPELEQPVFALPAGKLTEVLSSTRGYHIFKVEELRPAGSYSLDEVRERLRRNLHGRKMETLMREKLAGLRAAAKIVYLDPLVEATALGRAPSGTVVAPPAPNRGPVKPAGAPVAPVPTKSSK